MMENVLSQCICEPENHSTLFKTLKFSPIKKNITIVFTLVYPICANAKKKFQNRHARTGLGKEDLLECH